MSVLEDPVLSTLYDSCYSSLCVIRDTVLNMKNTNQFMLMTINRCIDYTKASNNVKLVPRLETINFLEVLYLPLNCMRGMQDSTVQTDFNWMPVSTTIAPYLITGMQFTNARY